MSERGERSRSLWGVAAAASSVNPCGAPNLLNEQPGVEVATSAYELKAVDDREASIRRFALPVESEHEDREAMASAMDGLGVDCHHFQDGWEAHREWMHGRRASVAAAQATEKPPL